MDRRANFARGLRGGVAWALGIASAALVCAADESLTYTLTPAFGEGRCKVELVWQTGGARGQSALGVAPSFGRVADVPALITNVEIAGHESARRDESLWIIRHRPGASLRVSYTVSPGRRSFDEWDDMHRPIACDEFFHGVGAAFLLVPNSGADTPGSFSALLSWRLGAGEKAACSWGVGRSVGATMTPRDLRESTYLAGQITTRTSTEGGRKVTVALPDRFAFSADEFLAMTTRIIADQCSFMSEKSFPDFVVTAIPVGRPLRENETRLAGSGLYNSFALFVPPKSRLDDAVDHLFAHELFHYWNGRVLTAAQPERLVYWFVEGLTDYYALRILLESGRWPTETYARWVNKHLREYAINPAIRATNEEIQQRYWLERDTVGQVAYQRGLLLGLRWHHLARERGVSGGLDKLLFSLVARGRAGLVLTNAAIREAGVKELGSWFGDEFDAYVSRAERVELPAECLAPRFVVEPVDVFAFELGFDRARSTRERRVVGLSPGSAAAVAGLREGDVLTGWTIPSTADEPVVLHVQRGEAKQTIEYSPRGAKRPAMRVRGARSGS